MIRLAVNKRLLLVAFALLLLVPLAAWAVTTPEIHAKIVDAETGKPQELVRAIVYAGKTVHTLAGEVEKPLFSKTFYFDAKDGEIVVPSQHFLVLDVLRFKDWKLVIKCPGYQELLIEGTTVKRLLRDNRSYPVTIRLKRYKTGGEWNRGHSEWESSVYMSSSEVDNPSNPSIYRLGEIEDYRWLIANWITLQHQRDGLTALMKEGGPKVPFREYLWHINQLCNELSKDHATQCRQARDEARRFVKSLPNKLQAKVKLKEWQSRYEWLTIGADR